MQTFKIKYNGFYQNVQGIQENRETGCNFCVAFKYSLSISSILLYPQNAISDSSADDIFAIVNEMSRNISHSFTAIIGNDLRIKY